MADNINRKESIRVENRVKVTLGPFFFIFWQNRKVLTLDPTIKNRSQAKLGGRFLADFSEFYLILNRCSTFA